MSILFISDSHFSHANILNFCNRPFSNAQEMDEQMIKNWNVIVKPNDIVYHLGDFAFIPFKRLSYLRFRLNGKIHLILGNHDKMIRENDCSSIFESVQNYKEIKIDKKLIVCFHYGQRVWRNSHHGSIHLYGHSHGTLPPIGKSVDVGVDCTEIHSNGPNDYRPIHLDEIFSYMNKKDIAMEDYHGNE